MTMEESFDDFLKVDIRAHTVIRAEAFPEACKSEIKFWIDFGLDISEKKSSAQVTRHCTPVSLVARQVAAVVDFLGRQTGKFMSLALVFGFPNDIGEV